MNALEIVTPLTTVLALALSLGMGAALFRVLREERRRSDARVAALIEAAAVPPPGEEIFRLKAEARAAERPKVEGPRPKAEGTSITMKVEPTGLSARQNVEPSASSLDLDLQSTPDVTAVSEMFSTPDRESPWGRRIGVAACVAAIVFVAGYVLLSRDTTMADSTVSNVAAQAQPAPLELLSLRHTQKRDSLTITGLVQNPRNGVALARVTAMAFLFSADGTFLASGRAPLDFSTIGPGEESPFVVTVPITGTVARYRVGFRGEDGRVIAHVDRRSNGTMALRN